MKLVKDTKIVRLPRSSRTVKQTLRKAALYAEKEGWGKIIIIGEGDNDVRGLYSKMTYYVAIGMLQTEVGANVKDLIDR